MSKHDKAKHDDSQDGYFGDWLNRGDPADEILKGYIDKPSLAKAFDKSERTIDRWRNMPDGLPYTTAGATVLFDVNTARDWLKSRMTRPNRRRRAV